MSVNLLNGIGAGAVTNTNINKPAEIETAKKPTSLTTDNSDKFAKYGTSYTPAYTKETASKKESPNSTLYNNTINDIAANAEERITQFEKFIKSMLSHQGSKSMYNSKEVQKFTADYLRTEDGMADFISSNPLKLDLSKIEDMPDKDDYFSVENTAQRIFDFAKSISGGDDSKFAMLKEAVEKGFEAAYSAVGGKDKMPKITENTYNKVMSMFDDWEKKINEKNQTSGASNKPDVSTTDKSNNTTTIDTK